MLWEKAEQIDTNKCEDIKYYLAAIAKHEAINERNKIRPHVELDENVIGNSAKVFTDIELREVIYSALQQLKTEYQIILLKYYYQEIPVKKGGTQYQIPEVMFTSEALVIFTKEDGSGWELSEGDEIQIHLEEYETKDFRVEGQMIGYKLIHNGELKKAEDVREGLRQNCILSATEKGEYYPCLIGRSSDITTLKNGTITVIEK